MLRALAIRAVVLAIAFLVVDALMDTFTIDGGFFTALGLAVVYGLVSAIIGTLLRLLALPLLVITVGLFEFVINAFLLLITDWLTDRLEIDGFTSALAAAVILAIVSVVVGLIISLFLPDTERS